MFSSLKIFCRPKVLSLLKLFNDHVSYSNCVLKMSEVFKHLFFTKKSILDVWYGFEYTFECRYVKSVRIRSFSDPYFPIFWLNKERYGVSSQIWENTDQKNVLIWTYSRSVSHHFLKFCMKKILENNNFLILPWVGLLPWVSWLTHRA